METQTRLIEIPKKVALSLKILRNLQHKTGLYSAAAKNCKTGYNKAWLRDNIYAVLGLECVGDTDSVKKTYAAIFDLLLKHEYKIDWAIREKPDTAFKYIHARYHPLTFEEFREEWGNKQNDAVGAFLFKVGQLQRKGINVLRDENDLRILQKIVSYLESLEYWHDKDNGMWEENEEMHSSSIGACVAGLRAVKGIVNVPEELIRKGEGALNSLLPRESETKEADLALLSLIYPYNVVDDKQRNAILKNVEENLVRNKGAIRYKGDLYYNNGDGIGGEAEWCFGFPWLAIIYKNLRNMEKYRFYLKKTYEVINENGELPELYFASSEQHNENSPLAWAQAMFVVAVM